MIYLRKKIIFFSKLISVFESVLLDNLFGSYESEKKAYQLPTFSPISITRHRKTPHQKNPQEVKVKPQISSSPNQISSFMIYFDWLAAIISTHACTLFTVVWDHRKEKNELNFLQSFGHWRGVGRASRLLHADVPNLKAK